MRSSQMNKANCGVWSLGDGYSTKEGFVGLFIYEFDSAKADEAMEQINNAYWQFNDIPDHNYELIPCEKARDAAKRFLELAQ